MTRRDWLLLLIAYEGAPRGLDPVRLQKGMFLFGQETDVPAGEKYAFRPYNYGPMSRDLYSDVDALVADGLVERMPVEGQSWSRFRATDEGIRCGRKLMERGKRKDPEAARHLFEIKQLVASQTFESLLTLVYDRYPTYAEKSIFRHRD